MGCWDSRAASAVTVLESMPPRQIGAHRHVAAHLQAHGARQQAAHFLDEVVLGVIVVLSEGTSQ